MRKSLKYKTRRIKELTESRNKWKEKNRVKSYSIKQMRQQLGYQASVKRHQFPYVLIKLCVLLRLQAGCSYRKITKIIQLLSFCSLLKVSRIPCANTIQNWVTKMGLYELKDTDNELLDKEVILMIDESIRIGCEKQLLVLSTPYEKQGVAPLNFDDVKVVYFGGKISWTGALIQDVLQHSIDQIGFKVKAILTDEDSKLKLAARLQGLPRLNDICHVMGSCLRKTFEKSVEYQAFTKALSQYKSKGVNQPLTYLLPPHQRTKSRFLNQAPLVSWAERLLADFDKLSPEEQAFFKDLPTHYPILMALKACIELAKQISLPLKQKGLSKSLVKLLREKIAVSIQEPQTHTANYLTIFLNYLDQYMIDYQEFLIDQKVPKQINLPVSSEVIESLFGHYKRMVSPNKLTGTTKINLEIAAHCSSELEDEYYLKQALEDTFMTDIDGWIKKNSTVNQLVKRREFFKKRT